MTVGWVKFKKKIAGLLMKGKKYLYTKPVAVK